VVADAVEARRRLAAGGLGEHQTTGVGIDVGIDVVEPSARPLDGMDAQDRPRHGFDGMHGANRADRVERPR
jgi:hypothetical protein